ncbi:LutC/YkgG family protein [Haloechinothrix halophila]|uniref:LutC/YkgG family protein n=1 Tax=Haloechinothrix halophila TaxID=1069073 RepID=UPI0004266B6C|nr:LUD domain-containing protein [Haloechinothrix halophila]
MSSAREEILASIRSALADAPPDVDVSRGYRDVPAPADLVELFAERVADYRATVTRCAHADVAGAIRAALGDACRVVVPGDLPYPIDDALDDDLSASELDTVDAVVTTAAIGIAITGTIVLDHGPGQGRRAVSLVPDRHVCVIRTDQIVAGVPDAIARLDPERPQTWISGPSATSDIELNRVEGVHGPRQLHVVVVHPD